MLIASCGAVLTMALGVLGLLAPARAARLVGLTPQGARGTSEVRATYGGLFFAMGLACLVLQHPAAFAVAAAAWLGAALARLASMAVARHASALDLGGVVLEGTIGALLACGAC
jgi:hypothetical protein